MQGQNHILKSEQKKFERKLWQTILRYIEKYQDEFADQAPADHILIF